MGRRLEVAYMGRHPSVRVGFIERIGLLGRWILPLPAHRVRKAFGVNPMDGKWKHRSVDSKTEEAGRYVA
jgi:hypothetical protein